MMAMASNHAILTTRHIDETKLKLPYGGLPVGEDGFISARDFIAFVNENRVKYWMFEEGPGIYRILECGEVNV